MVSPIESAVLPTESSVIALLLLLVILAYDYQLAYSDVNCLKSNYSTQT